MRTIRLLLVDDNREYLEAATALLKSQPEIEIVGSALTGQEALELVPQTHPDVVLLDLLMPEMNGLEVAKRLKAEANPPRIIIVTLEDQNVFQEVATAHGADGFLSKLSIPTELLTMLHSLCE